MGPDLQNYDAVIFDLFRTLISLDDAAGSQGTARDYLGIPKTAWNEALFSDAEDRLRGRIAHPDAVIRDIVGKLDPAIAADKIQHAAELRARQFKRALVNIRPHILNTVAQLKSRGKLLGLISNADHIEAGGWPRSAISGHFDCAIFSCNVGYIKPEEQIYRIGLERLKVSPRRCLFVGDGGNDELAGAKRVGMDTVITLEFISEPMSDAVRRRRSQADYEVGSIDVLLGP